MILSVSNVFVLNFFVVFVFVLKISVASVF